MCYTWHNDPNQTFCSAQTGSPDRLPNSGCTWTKRKIGEPAEQRWMCESNYLWKKECVSEVSRCRPRP